METQLEYVLRMLNKKDFNLPGIADSIGTSKQNLYNLRNRKDGKAKVVQDLYNHFKSIGV